MQKLIKILAIVAIAAAGCAIDNAAMQGETMKRMQNSPQFDGEKFTNHIPMNPQLMSFKGGLTALKDWLTKDAQTEPDTPVATVALPSEFGAPVSEGIRAWWLGHSTMLIEIDGVRVLTDPIWSQRASMFEWIGPKRYFDPIVDLEQLPALDAVVISHDHYDHLDEQTIRSLARISDVHFVVPLAVGAHLRGWGVADERITELDWWQETRIKDVALVATPARHMSGRGLRDQNHTLWASWALIGPQHRVYFGGDSGLSEKFEQIGDRYGPFDLTMLDTGQYGTLWPDVHMGPEQAIIAQKALRGKMLLPIHWGMFTLSTHSWTEPAERMRVAADAAGIDIVQPKPGQTVELSSPLHNAAEFARKWWPTIGWRTGKEQPIHSTHIDPDWIKRMQARSALRHQNLE